MSAPTGAAKTIAAAAFALGHAARWGMRRVVVAVPFITITEQNAEVYRRLLDDSVPGVDPVVLEHHSNVDVDVSAPGTHRQVWQRMAAENWDAPFVVTTTVQLFESLFSRKPSRMRKVHRLAGSVIVLDEVQALPHRLLPQIADALRMLTQRLGATVLLSSATQPAWWSLGPLSKLDLREIVPDVEAAFASARRVRYRWWENPRPTLADVVSEALTHRQALVVVNTVRNARTAYEHANTTAGPGVRVAHLSTAMCAAHRRAMLAEVKKWLATGTPVCLVSTSLIEAGVDLDFPVVFRAAGPPESVAQVAGRCNRDGHLGPEGGLVVVFDPVDGGMPPSYGTQIDKAAMYFGPGRAEPDDVTALGQYFADLYRTLGVEDRTSVAATIREHRRRWDFPSVTDGPKKSNGGGRDVDRAFRLILDDTVPVAVHYGTDADRAVVRAALSTLRSPAQDATAWRQLQPYVTTVRRRTVQQPAVSALTTPVVGDLLEWIGDYDDGFGLVLEPRGEDFIL